MNNDELKAELQSENENSNLGKLLQRIIEIDNEAQKLTENAENMKAECESVITEKQKKMTDNYYETAKKRLLEIENDAQKKSEKMLAADIVKIASSRKKLEETFSANKEKWIAEIVTAVIS